MADLDSTLVNTNIESIKFEIESGNSQYLDYQMKLYNDGVHFDGSETDSIYANTIDLKHLEGEFHWTITFRGRDSSGNIIQRQKNGVINIVGTPPDVRYISPTGTIVEESLEIVFEVEDDGANGIIEVYIDGKEVKGLSTLIDTTNQNKWLCTAKIDWQLEPGEHVVEIIAWDNVRNQSAPEFATFVLAEKVAEIDDNIGDATGGGEIENYPAFLDRNELDIEAVRVYANVKSHQSTTSPVTSEEHDLGFSIQMNSLADLKEFYNGIIHLYLDTDDGGNSGLVSGTGNAVKLKENFGWEKAIIIKTNTSDDFMTGVGSFMYEGSEGNKVPIDVQYNTTTNTISFKIKVTSAPEHQSPVLKMCVMSFGYSSYTENNIMPILPFAGNNQFKGSSGSNIVDLLNNTNNEKVILQSNSVEIPAININLPGYVDRIAPVISGVSPSGIVFNRRPEIIANVEDDIELSIVNCQLSSTADESTADSETIQLVGGFDTASGIMSYQPINDLNYGDYEVQVTAWDTTGNKTEKSGSFEVKEIFNDTTFPFAQISSPVEGDFVKGILDLTGNVQDENLASYEIWLKAEG